MNLMVLRINFYVLIFILQFLMYKNVSGFICEMKKDYRGNFCNLQLDSYNSARQANYKDNDILWIDFYTELFNISHLGLSEYPICERFKNLKELQIIGNDEKYLDENFLYYCEQLIEINLNSMSIKEISEFFFTTNQKLEAIELSSLNLITLPEKLFLNQIKLEYLKLVLKDISFLPPNIFKSLTKLRYLYLLNNSLKTLNPAWFESLENLNILGLNGNKIEDLPKSVLKTLTNLEYLDLSSNQLTVIHSTSFGSHLKLKTINLRFNKIDAIDEKLIDNSIVSTIYIEKNICYNEDIEKREELKSKLQKCFSNYRPRQDELSLPWNFTHQTSDYSCGIHKVPIPQIYAGGNIYRGEFPWNTVLKQYRGGHFCGGTILSKKAVVTAAHCLKGKDNEPNFSPSDFSILLGAHNLSLANEPNRVTVWAKAIHIHPDWNVDYNIYEADIAILEIDNHFEFSPYIQPICIPKPRTGQPNAVEGVIAGFGITEDRKVSNRAKKLIIPIIDFHTCIRNSPDHKSFISARTFCGGPGGGKGVCSGDSGTGLLAYRMNKYYLIGVVSTSLSANEHGCNVDSYGVYTNIADFYDWIMTGMKN